MGISRTSGEAGMERHTSTWQIRSIPAEPSLMRNSDHREKNPVMIVKGFQRPDRLPIDRQANAP